MAPTAPTVPGVPPAPAFDDEPGFWRRIRRWPWLRIGLGTLAVLFIIAVVPPFRHAAATLTGKIILLAATPFAPDVSGFDELARPSRVLAADGTEVGALGPEARDPVPLSALPDHVVNAVLAAEDADFYSHDGVDPDAAVRALFNTVKGNRQGGSTITQQLAKLNYTGGEGTVFRKLKEVLYATELEKKYSKDQLLERYLNQVYFGRGAYGIGLAANRFFGVGPEALDPGQAATLAGKIRSPNALDPWENPAEVRERRDQVLKNMNKNDWLSDADLDATLGAETLPVEGEPPVEVDGGSRAPDFMAYVAREAEAIGALGSTPEARRQQILTGGYTVETTVDLADQDAALAAAQAVLGEPDDPATAIASVVPGDGAIRVLFGGLDPALQFDLASQGRRQPGSSFKPYVYLAMLEDGIDPRTGFDAGSPKTLQCRGAPWTVNNYEGEGAGAASVDTAMVGSINTVFAQVMTEVGPDNVKDVAVKAGIPEDEVDPPECAMALGGLHTGVSPLEQAAGFATFAAEGTYAEPYSISRIVDRDGDVVYEHRPKTVEAFDETQVKVLNGVLQQVVTSGTGRAASIGRPMAGKTGTTENYGNAWFIGYVPQLSTAVWVGHPEGDVPMDNVHGVAVTGGSYPAQTFSAYMREALNGVPVVPLATASPDELGLRTPEVTPPPPPSLPPEDLTTTTTVFSEVPGFEDPTFPDPGPLPVPPGQAPQPPIVTPTQPPVIVTTTTQPRPTTTTTVPSGGSANNPGKGRD